MVYLAMYYNSTMGMGGWQEKSSRALHKCEEKIYHRDHRGRTRRAQRKREEGGKGRGKSELHIPLFSLCALCVLPSVPSVVNL
jgi:hypothetical protein